MKVNAKLFVVPNAALRYDGCGNGPAGFRMKTSELSHLVDVDRGCRKYGIVRYGETDISTRWVQVWVSDDGEDDASSHGWSIKGMPTRCAPNTVPESFVKRILDEGEVETVVRYDANGDELADPIHIVWSYRDQNRYCHLGSGRLLLGIVAESCDKYTTPEVKDALTKYLDALDERNKK